MKFFALSVTALVFLAFGVIASACGDDGGGGLSLEEYFQQVDASFEDRDQQVQALGEGASLPDDASEEDIASYLRDQFEELASITSDWRSQVDELEPPSEAEDAHNELLVALEEVLALFEGAADEVPATLSLEEAGQYDPFPGGEGTESFTRLDEACAALQTIADDNSIDADLACEGAEEG